MEYARFVYCRAVKPIALLITFTAICVAGRSAINLDISRSLEPSGRPGGMMINCSIDTTAAGIDTLARLAVFGSRPYGAGDDLDQLAVFDIWSKTPKLAKYLEVAGVSVVGKLSSDPLTNPHLALIWRSHKDSTRQVYRCVANGMDSDGQRVSVSSTVQVGAMDASCCHKMDKLQTELTGLSDKMEKLQEKMSSLEQNINLKFRLLGTSIDTGRFDVSSVYQGRVYLVSKKVRIFNITTANILCRKSGGYLVELDDAQEYQFVFNLVSTIRGANSFWTGGNDIKKEGTWVYYNSKKPVPKLSWTRGQPDNFGGREDCMEFRLNFGGLNDWLCYRKGKFICEIPI